MRFSAIEMFSLLSPKAPIAKDRRLSPGRCAQREAAPSTSLSIERDGVAMDRVLDMKCIKYTK
jgi:hypothetical protein